MPLLESVRGLAAAGIGHLEWDAGSNRVRLDPLLARLCGLPESGFGGPADAFEARRHPDDRPAVRGPGGDATGSSSIRVRLGPGSTRVLVRGSTPAVPGARRVRGAVVELTPDGERDEDRLSRLYVALRRLHRAILVARDRDHLLGGVCEALVSRTDLTMAWVGCADPTTSRMAPLASAGDATGYLHRIAVRTDDVPGGRGPSGRAFRAAAPVIVNDVRDNPEMHPWFGELEERGWRAVAAFPILLKDAVWGTLNVYAQRPGYFRDEEIALLEDAAVDIAFGLENVEKEEARRAAESQLRAERDFSDAVINSLPGVLYLYDRSGRFLRWNSNLERVTELSAEEVARTHPLDLFHGPDRERVATAIEEVFRTGTATIEADFVSTRSRTVTPYFFTGHTLEIGGEPCLVGVGIDVSERRRAESARMEIEARYRTLFDYSPVGILVADHESRYLDANPAMCAMLGHPRERLIGMTPDDIIAPPELSHVPGALKTVLASEVHRREWVFRRADGTTFPADVVATKLPGELVLAMVSDITQRKQVERTLVQMNEILERRVGERTAALTDALARAESADRLKSAFLATMSHELRTPLNSILGFTGILIQGLAGPLNEEQTRQLGMVQKSGRHLLELINDVLDLSKIEAQQLRIARSRFDLAALLRSTVAALEPQAAAKGLRCAISVEPGVGEIDSDRRRLEQIVLNLLNNAIKFTDRGEVTVHAAPAEHAGRVAVRLAVHDTGGGMEPAELATLFQPFRQLDSALSRQHEGTGLGLVICRKLAELLGGTIAVESAKGQGSTFTVLLPVEHEGKP